MSLLASLVRTSAGVFLGVAAVTSAAARGDTVTLEAGGSLQVNTYLNGSGVAVSTDAQALAPAHCDWSGTCTAWSDSATMANHFGQDGWDLSVTAQRCGLDEIDDRGLVYFQANRNLDYALSASLATDGPSTYITIGFDLIDLTAGNTFLQGIDDGHGAGRFSLDSASPNSTLFAVRGEPSGTLLAGHHYEAFVFADTFGFTGAATTDQLQTHLSFSPVSPNGAAAAPLPRTTWAGLSLLGGLGVLTLVRRQRLASTCRAPRP